MWICLAAAEARYARLWRLFRLDLNILGAQGVNQCRIIRSYGCKLRTILEFTTNRIFHYRDFFHLLLVYLAQELGINDFLLVRRLRRIVVNDGNRDNDDEQVKAHIPEKFIQS